MRLAPPTGALELAKTSHSAPIHAELPEESISVYLMYGDEITLTRGTGALWQLGAGPASLIDLGLCGCSLARKLRSKSMSASGGVSRGAESWYGTWSNGV